MRFSVFVVLGAVLASGCAIDPDLDGPRPASQVPDVRVDVRADTRVDEVDTRVDEVDSGRRGMQLCEPLLRCADGRAIRPFDTDVDCPAEPPAAGAACAARTQCWWCATDAEIFRIGSPNVVAAQCYPSAAGPDAREWFIPTIDGTACLAAPDSGQTYEAPDAPDATDGDWVPCVPRFDCDEGPNRTAPFYRECPMSPPAAGDACSTGFVNEGECIYCRHPVSEVYPSDGEDVLLLRCNDSAGSWQQYTSKASGFYCDG